jgi:fucose permease
VITLGIALGLFGFAFGAVDVAINAQAVAVEHLYDRPIMGTFHALFSMGGMTGAGVGCMAAWAGLSPGWHFVIVSIVLLIPSILIYTWLIAEKTPHHHTGAITKNQTRALSFLGAIAFCTALGEGAMGDWSGVYLRQVSHSTAPVAALGFAAFSLAMTVGRFLADRFTARLGPMNMVRVSSAVAAAGLILAMLHPTILFAIIGFTCVGAGLAALIPIVFSAAGRTAGVKPSVAIASVAATGYFGFLAGPPVIGVASKFVTLRWTLFLVVIGCGVAIALAHQVQRPVPDRSL